MNDNLRRQMESYQKAIIGDPELRGLYAEISGLHKSIAERRHAIALEQGIVVADSSELKCPEHPDAAITRGERIQGSHEDLRVYVCEGCKPIISEPLAYDCPVCGIVRGKFSKRKHNSIGMLSGAEGEDYHCWVCDVQIGYYYWKFS